MKSRSAAARWSSALIAAFCLWSAEIPSLVHADGVIHGRGLEEARVPEGCGGTHSPEFESARLHHADSCAGCLHQFQSRSSVARPTAAPREAGYQGCGSPDPCSLSGSGRELGLGPRAPPTP